MWGREIGNFKETELILNLTGLTGYFALKRKLKIPYHTITDVFVDYFDAPLWMLRKLGTSFPPYIYEGSFKYADVSYFLSYERREPLVMIDLKGHKKYNYVIFQIYNPASVVAEIRRRLRDYNEKKQGVFI
ncbi:hypothetical protein ACSVDA_10245 [Cytobacillus sp. Hm23]